jgi:hypothetical protein
MKAYARVFAAALSFLASAPSSADVLGSSMAFAQ